MSDDSDKDISEVVNEDDAAGGKNLLPLNAPLDKVLSDAANKKKKFNLKYKFQEKHIFYAVGGVVLLFVILGLFSCQPKKGNMAYGICSTFLELNTPYPQTLRYTDLAVSGTAVRIYFTSIDPFGQYQQEMIECTYGPDEKVGLRLNQVTRNRRPVDPEIVRKFNETLPAVIKSDPYRVMPPEWKNQLLEE